MATYRVKIDKTDDGALPPSNVRSQTTKAQVHGILAGFESHYEDVGVMTEVQRRGVADYVRAIALGTNTSSVETAINAII